MTFIIPERRTPSFRERLMSGFGRAAEVGATQIPQLLLGKQEERKQLAAQERENQQLSELIGQDISGIQDPKIRHSIVQSLLKGKQDRANKPDLSGPLQALDNLESLVGKEGIGTLGSANFRAKARYNRGEFESTQAAILPIFKSFFPRGMTQDEFNYVKEHYIPQPTDSEAKIRGKIKGLRALVQQQGGMPSELDKSMTQFQGKTKEMRDSQGNVYDIPEHLFNQARAQGLQ